MNANPAAMQDGQPPAQVTDQSQDQEQLFESMLNFANRLRQKPADNQGDYQDDSVQEADLGSQAFALATLMMEQQDVESAMKGVTRADAQSVLEAAKRYQMGEITIGDMLGRIQKVKDKSDEAVSRTRTDDLKKVKVETPGSGSVDSPSKPPVDWNAANKAALDSIR